MTKLLIFANKIKLNYLQEAIVDDESIRNVIQINNHNTKIRFKNILVKRISQACEKY